MIPATIYMFLCFLQVKVQVKRHLMEELPETSDGIAQWCRDTFVTKVLQSKIKLEFLKNAMHELIYHISDNDCFLNCQDAILEKLNTTNIFSEQELQDIGRPKRSFLVR